MTAAAGGEVSVDAFLGGRVEAVQPAHGHHRSGLEAVLIASALDASTAGEVIDLGSGVGVAGLCLAHRCPNAQVLLVDRDPYLLSLAEDALRRQANARFARRVHTIVADVAAPEAERLAAGLVPGRAAAIAANPPFYPPYKVTMSPSAGKAAAHAQDVGIEDWCRFAAWALRPGGILVMVAHAESLAELVDHLPGRFGSIAVMPVHPRPDLPAARILIRAVKGSRGPLTLLPGLVLHGAAGGAFAPPISAMLKGEADLATVHPPWRAARTPAAERIEDDVAASVAVAAAPRRE